MEINSQEYTQKLSEKYQLHCLQFFQEIIVLQTQIELKDKQIKDLESKLAELEIEVILDELPESVNIEEINVNSTVNT